MWSPGDVKLVAVSVGPGSFTGLRVGVTTAKTLAYTLGADVIGVNTLEAIATRAPDDVACLWAVIDAYRHQVFAAKFVREPNDTFRLSIPIQLLDIDRWLECLRPGDPVTGPALRKYACRIPASVQMLDASLWSPTASCVGQLGWQHYQRGARSSLWSLAPLYLRPSAAEERRAWGVGRKE
jgi:tRNA threonylcarbamoyladenosine biosynthesis protein TsaB